MVRDFRIPIIFPLSSIWNPSFSAHYWWAVQIMAFVILLISLISNYTRTNVNPQKKKNPRNKEPNWTVLAKQRRKIRKKEVNDTCSLVAPCKIAISGSIHFKTLPSPFVFCTILECSHHFSPDELFSFFLLEA